MTGMREWLARLADWARRDTLDRELAEELAFHRAQLERDALARGADPAEARRLARRRLGDEARVREAARDRWAFPWPDLLRRDLRLALRALRRSPAFAATAALTLALGIGANAAMFGVVDRLLLRPPPLLRDPGTAHLVYLRRTARAGPITGTSMAYPRYLALRDGTSSFSEVAAYAPRQLAVGVGDAARERRVLAVTASFFRFFDAPPARGRYFAEREDVPPAGAPVAVLAHDFWRSELGGRDVLGETLQIGDVAATIVGVAPPGLVGLEEGSPPVAFIPMGTFGAAMRYYDLPPSEFYGHGFGAVGGMLVRRKPDVTPDAASEDASRAYLRSWETQRAVDPGAVTPPEIARPTAIVGAVRQAAGPAPATEVRVALWVTGVAAIVLLIACANVTNLFLARAVARERDVAVRRALGVGRWRLVSMAVTESLVVALAGAVGGLLVAHWGGAAVRALLAQPAGGATGAFTDGRVLAVAFALALVVGVGTGAVTALATTRRGPLAPALRLGVRAGSGHRTRLRAALLVVQGALSVALLVGALLFVRSLGAARAEPMGYAAAPVLVVSPSFRGAPVDSATRDAVMARLLAAARALPGVAGASWASGAPLWRTTRFPLHVPGVDSAAQPPDVTASAVGADYFRVLGTRILRGRGLTEEDRRGAPRVVVLSEALARALWPGRDPLGRCVRVGADDAPCTTVVGIAEDVVQGEQLLGSARRFQFYLSIAQFAPPPGAGWLLLRTRGDPAAHAEEVRKALQPAMPGTSYVTTHLLREDVESAHRSWRLGTTMFGAFAALALAVAAVGLYGVVGYEVTRRTHELGVRAALGAGRTALVRLVVTRSVRLALAGVAAGTAIALVASRWLQPLLFRQSATDPAVYGVVAATMLAVALAASASPAARATKSDPTAALRSE